MAATPRRSFPRKPESTAPAFIATDLVGSTAARWIPAFAGMMDPVRSLSQILFAAIAVHDVLDHLDAEAGTARRVHPPFDMLERLGDKVVLHRVAERLQLEQLAGRRIERDRQARRSDD